MSNLSKCTGLCPCNIELKCFYCSGRLCCCINGQRKVLMNFTFWDQKTDKNVVICNYCVVPVNRPQAK